MSFTVTHRRLLYSKQMNNTNIIVNIEMVTDGGAMAEKINHEVNLIDNRVIDVPQLGAIIDYYLEEPVNLISEIIQVGLNMTQESVQLKIDLIL